MRYFLDTEFTEGPQSKFFGLFKTKPTIDLISIAIVSEDNREYYAVSKDFNLKEAWNRCDIHHGIDEEINKIYWIRENVLRPIYEDFIKEYFNDQDIYRDLYPFDYQTMKRVIELVGKPKKVIAREIIQFIYPQTAIKFSDSLEEFHRRSIEYGWPEDDHIKFYGYDCDYDWVVFCWLFGYMKDLPEGFPMYARDLKQMLDEREHDLGYDKDHTGGSYKLEIHPDYPQQSNEHHPLNDARWNKQLFQFIQAL